MIPEQNSTKALKRNIVENTSIITTGWWSCWSVFAKYHEIIVNYVYIHICACVCDYVIMCVCVRVRVCKLQYFISAQTSTQWIHAGAWPIGRWNLQLKDLSIFPADRLCKPYLNFGRHPLVSVRYSLFDMRDPCLVHSHGQRQMAFGRFWLCAAQLAGGLDQPWTLVTAGLDSWGQKDVCRYHYSSVDRTWSHTWTYWINIYYIYIHIIRIYIYIHAYIYIYAHLTFCLNMICMHIEAHTAMDREILVHAVRVEESRHRSWSCWLQQLRKWGCCLQQGLESEDSSACTPVPIPGWVQAPEAGRSHGSSEKRCG